MLRFNILISSLVLGCIAGNAQFSVKLDSSRERMIVSDGSFVQDASVSSGFTFGGIDVADIGEISSSALTQDAAGSVVTLPEGMSSRKRAAILDLNSVTGEDERGKRHLYSCEYMLQIAGLPYFVTTSLDEAIGNSSMIILTSSPKKSLDSEAIAKLSDYVASGAILMSPNILSSASTDLKNLFGVSDVSIASKKSGRVLNWTSGSHPELVYIDEPEERTTAIGSINVSYFTPSTATKLAWFDDEPEHAAVVRNNIGKGAAYLFGLLWRDVIQRPQLDKDLETGRGKSNTFEPSADVYPLFLRAACVAANPITAWKYTVPDGYSSVLIPTHDCDSRTAYDAMHYMADYEKSLGLNGHYFLTVHYFKQPDYMSDFYCEETLPAVRSLLTDGHTVGSHSICHFPDFGSYRDNELEKHFPMKEYTKEEYALYASHDLATKTSYGSTWAEIVLSKRILENDLGNKVRSFRSGHLCVNPHMPEAQRIAGYNFSSCYTASSVQSQFPFMQRLKNDWTGDFSGTLQIPLHFSDVFHTDAMSEDNYEEKAKLWIELFNKMKGNYASSVVLIHPNREWKMLAQKVLVDNMDLTDCGLYNFEAYGDFWLGRTAFDFESFWLPEERKFIIRADAAAIAANPSLSLMVELPAFAESEIANITLIDENSKVHPVRIRHVSDSRYLVML